MRDGPTRGSWPTVRRPIVCAAAVLVLVIGACGQSNETAEAAADTLTRRQRDSIFSSLPLPGASRIMDATRAADAAAARATAHDTIG
jgi:hypothetical protein